MIKLGDFVKTNCSGAGLSERLGIDPVDAFKIFNKIGVVSEVIDKNTFAVKYNNIDNGFDYRFEKRYLMKA